MLLNWSILRGCRERGTDAFKMLLICCIICSTALYQLHGMCSVEHNDHCELLICSVTKGSCRGLVQGDEDIMHLDVRERK